MNKNTLKSIGGIFAGLLFIFVSSHLTDFVLEKSGIMKQPFHENSTLFIVFVTLYRLVFSIAGCYIAAILAPDRPMRHAMILGVIGVVLSTLGLIAMWEVPPRWYPVSLLIFALPCAWLGGKLKTK